MGFWWAVPAVLGAVGAVSSRNDANAQNQNQMAWNRYNAQVAYGSDMSNIELQSAITEVNLTSMMATSDIDKQVADARDIYNQSLLTFTAIYNDLLFEQDIEDVWTQHGLDVELLSLQRMRERGEMVASQSVSGTVIGEGSNEAAIIDQMAQEEMDKFVLKTGADIQASKISNARAQSMWEAEQTIKGITFEGRVRNIESNARNVVNATTMLTESAINTMASIASATSRLNAGMAGAQNQAASNSAGINNNFMSGMFGAASSAVTGYYGSKSV